MLWDSLGVTLVPHGWFYVLRVWILVWYIMAAAH